MAEVFNCRIYIIETHNRVKQMNLRILLICSSVIILCANAMATPKAFSFYDDSVNFDASSSIIAEACLKNVEKYHDFKHESMGSKKEFLKHLKKVNKKKIN